MSNSIAPGSSAAVNVNVTALTTNPNVPVTYKTIILKKNLVNGVNTLTQEMMSATNTKYVVKYDYVLGEDITIPENCILKFDGGSISGTYTLTLQNTYIDGSKVNIDCPFNGTIKNTEVYFDWFNPEYATREQVLAFLNAGTANPEWGSVPVITNKNSTILNTLVGLFKNIVFGEGRYIFNQSISTAIINGFTIKGAGMTKTLLWFPQSAAFEIGNTNVFKFQDLAIEAWGNCLHINASNAVQFLQLINCHLVSYNDNVVERVKNSGPIWGSDFASCHIGTTGNQKSCFYRINSTTNNFWHCGNASWFWEAWGLLQKGNRIKAFWHNSTFFADKCGFDSIQLEYLCFEDSDSELGAISPWSFIDLTIEGTQDISQGMNAVVYTTAARNKRLFCGNVHTYGWFINNPTYGYAPVINNGAGVMSIYGNYYFGSTKSGNVVYGAILNQTNTPIVSADNINESSSASISYVLPYAGSTGSYKKFFVYQGTKNADTAKEYFIEATKEFIQAAFNLHTPNGAYLQIHALPNQTITIGNTIYRMAEDGSALIATPLERLGSGTTTNRPTDPAIGFQYYDTTLNQPIWHKGSNVWVDATGATV